MLLVAGAYVMALGQPHCVPPTFGANCTLQYCDVFLDVFHLDGVEKTRTAWQLLRLIQGSASLVLLLSVVERLARYACVRSAEGARAGGVSCLCSCAIAKARWHQLCCRHRGSIQLVALLHVLVIALSSALDAVDPSGWCGIYPFAVMDVLLDANTCVCFSLILLLTYGFFAAIASNLPPSRGGMMGICDQLVSLLRRHCCCGVCSICGVCNDGGGGGSLNGGILGSLGGSSRGGSRGGSGLDGSSITRARLASRPSATLPKSGGLSQGLLLNDDALTRASRRDAPMMRCGAACRRCRPCEVHAYVWTAQLVVFAAVTLVSGLAYGTPVVLLYVIADGIVKPVLLLTFLVCAFACYLFFAQRISRSLLLLLRDKRSEVDRLRARGGTIGDQRRDVAKLHRQRRRLHCIVLFAVIATALTLCYYAYDVVMGVELVVDYSKGRCHSVFCREKHAVFSLVVPTLLRLAAGFWGLQSVWNIQGSAEEQRDAAWEGQEAGGDDARGAGAGGEDAAERKKRGGGGGGGMLSDPWGSDGEEEEEGLG